MSSFAWEESYWSPDIDFASPLEHLIQQLAAEESLTRRTALLEELKESPCYKEWFDLQDPHQNPFQHCCHSTPRPVGSHRSIPLQSMTWAAALYGEQTPTFSSTARPLCAAAAADTNLLHKRHPSAPQGSSNSTAVAAADDRAVTEQQLLRRRLQWRRQADQKQAAAVWGGPKDQSQSQSNLGLKPVDNSGTSSSPNDYGGHRNALPITWPARKHAM